MDRRQLIVAGVGLLAAGTLPARAATPGATTLVKTSDGYQLVRDGKPYFVHGVGGYEQLPLLKSLGGNSIRTWGVETAGRDLDAAHAQGLTVTVGIWLGHASDGFRYDDAGAVAAQFEAARKAISAFKNHPALLAWGIGNEMEGDGSDPRVWKAVQDIAAMAHREDPHHPTITVIAEIGGGASKAKAIQAQCPDVDIIGINAYGGLVSLADRLKEAAITKPYLVTEFGPTGQWEVGKTSWGAPLEPTSTDKARTYLAGYLRSVKNQPACLGSYAFLWGSKVEATPTWFGLLLPSGERLGAVDALSYLWTGKWGASPAPEILAFQTSVAEKRVKPGSPQTAVCVARGAAPLAYEYVVLPEAAGSASMKPGQKALDGSMAFVAPPVPGAYRLYVTVRDAAHGTAATANVPFFVEG